MLPKIVFVIYTKMSIHVFDYFVGTLVDVDTQMTFKICLHFLQPSTNHLIWCLLLT